MAGSNKWSGTGKVRKNSLMTVKATLTTKAAGSKATATVGDYYEFKCVAKNFFAMSDSPTWTVVTDDANELTGRTYLGKPEGIEPIELTTETVLPMVYGELQAHRLGGDIFTLEMKYDDPRESSIYTVSIPNCEIFGITAKGGETNAGSQTVIIEVFLEFSEMRRFK